MGFNVIKCFPASWFNAALLQRGYTREIIIIFTRKNYWGDQTWDSTRTLSDRGLESDVYHRTAPKANILLPFPGCLTQTIKRCVELAQINRDRWILRQLLCQLREHACFAHLSAFFAQTLPCLVSRSFFSWLVESMSCRNFTYLFLKATWDSEMKLFLSPGEF